MLLSEIFLTETNAPFNTKKHVNEVGPHYGKLDVEFGSDEYKVNKVTWLGEAGRMVKMTTKNSEPMWGNTFDERKISETANAIKNANGKAKFNAPLVHISIIDIEEIAENLEANSRGELMFDPAIDDVHTTTTSDRELDKYIIDEDQYLDDNSSDDEEREELRQEMEELKRTAIEEQWGDIGRLKIIVRDGNHRRAAAFLAGEPYVWGKVATQGILDDRARKYIE